MNENNDCSNVKYCHGVVCHNCVVRKYSGAGSSVHTINIGTLIEIHNIQEENVVFYIVKNDLLLDKDLFLCKRRDVVFVPENLWGPLLTVEEKARLSIAQDSRLAETLGNITVGNTVQVLGLDNQDAGIGCVTFKNSISKLGMGVYFGLKITHSKENLQDLIKKCSLLQPGTKGFPRGCDIVVAVDKLRPLKLSQENTYFSIGRRKSKFKKKVNSTLKDSCSTGLKSELELCLTNTTLKTSQYERERSNSKKISVISVKDELCDIPLEIGEKVVHIGDDGPERGTVKWLGFIKSQAKVGIEFENPIGTGTGTYNGVELFKAKHLHAALMPPETLIKLSDFEMNNSKDFGSQQKSTNNINYNRSNGQCCSLRSSLEDKSKMLKINSFHNSKYMHSSSHGSISFNHLKNCNEDHKERESGSNGLCRTECTLCFSHYPSRSFDSVKPNEKKLGNYRQCRSVDNDLQNKELLVNLQSSCIGMNKSPSKDLNDFVSSNWTEHCELHNFENDLHGLGDISPLLYSEYPYTAKRKNTQNNEELNLKSLHETGEKMNHSYDHSYIPIPVLEHNFAAKRGCDDSHYLNQWNENFYDVPSSVTSNCLNVNKSCYRGDYNRVDVLESDLRERYKRDFYLGRRHTLSPSHYNENSSSFPEYARLRKDIDIWEPQNSEHSSSDESTEYYDTPKPHYESGLPEKLGKGSVVELLYKGQPHYGVIRWVGFIPEDKELHHPPRLIAGVEMEEERSSFSDGTFRNKRYFHCNPKKAYFVPLSECRKDSRFSEDSNKLTTCMKTNSFGQLDCPIVEGTIPPINRKGDIEAICGKNRGIQGHHNSCYLDATLFAMFAFTSVFDSLLYRPQTVTDIPQYSEVQRVLKEEIVNPLRKNLYVRADRVMKLRTLLENLSSVSGLTCDEKDPEEFLNSLLAQILKAEPFLKLSSGQEAFHYQLFVEKDERLTFPSVQQLFEQSFVTSDIKLKQVPSCLIIQMPRFGKSFKMYSRIFPPQLLDVTDIIENSPRQCTVCGKLAEYECKDCFGQNGIGNGLENISFCKVCLDTAHNHHCRARHNYRSITVPLEFFDLQEHCSIPRIYMELFAVVCIETSHYVAFVKCGTGSEAPWCFFDSMADRKGEQNGYNIPEMVACPDLPYWLSEEGAKTLNEMKDERQLPEHAKRLLCDAYMCMYQSPDVMMYR